MKTNIKTVLSSILLGSFALAPVSSAFAQLQLVSDVTVDVTPVAATVTATATAGSVSTTSLKVEREALQRAYELKREEIRRIEGAKAEEMKALNAQKKEDYKDLREKREDLRDQRKASSSEARKERRDEMVKRQMASTTDRILALTTKLGKIGTEIKSVVEGQASSSVAIAEAIAKAEGRSGLKRFFLGSDYKNLGQVISEAAKTSARINQLDNQISKMASSTEKTALVESVTSLKTQVAELEQYVKDNVNKFSLFGWFTKRL